MLIGTLDELDAISQLTQIQYADGNIISFEYDLNGNRTLMDDPVGISTHIYDSRNRPITKTRTIDGMPYTVETEYNAVCAQWEMEPVFKRLNGQNLHRNSNPLFICTMELMFFIKKKDIENLEVIKRKAEEKRGNLIEAIRQKCECALPEEYEKES